MKNKQLKLFLLLGAIILSLFAFASCKKSAAEIPTPQENEVHLPKKSLI